MFCFLRHSLILGQDIFFEYSSIQIFKYSNIQIFKYSNIQIFKYSNIQIFKYSNIQIFKYSNIQIAHIQIAHSQKSAHFFLKTYCTKSTISLT